MFLLVSHDAGGTVPPMLAIAEALLARGHDVLLLGQPSIRQWAVAVGCRFEPFSAVPDYERTRPLEEQLDLVLAAMAGPTVGEDMLRVAEGGAVDAVVFDCNLAGAAAAAQRLGAPSAVLLHSLYRTYVDVWFGALWPFFDPAVNTTRAALGVDPVSSWTEMFARHDRVYACVPPVFNPPSTQPDAVRHFGFLVPRGAPAAALDDEAAAARVLISLSTTDLRQAALLQAAIDGVAQLGVPALVTTGGVIDPADLRVPPSVVVRDYVPHHRVLPFVDVVVTHAGLGTVAAALANGKPLVCLPIARDQPLNAERVAALGAGRTVDATAATADAIADAVQALRADPACHDAAAALQAMSEELGGAPALALDLEGLLAER